MESKLDILLVSSDEATHNQILNSLDTDESNIGVIPPEDVVREVNRQTRDIIIFIQPENDTAVELIQYIKSVNPSCYVIFLANTSDVTLLRNITKAGAEDFFIFPDELSLFLSRFPTITKNYSLKKHSQDEPSKMGFGRGRGQIFSFYSGNGGTGKSIISSAFAQTLKLESTAEVILIDLNFQFGGIETLLSIDSNRSIADLTPVISELNENHIRNVSNTESHSKMEILISPCDAEVGETLNEEFVAKLLRTCRRSFDYVILDLPSSINNQVVTALEESDKIFYVLTPGTPELKVLKQYEELSVRLGIEIASRMEIVFNQTGKENEVQQKDIKNILRFPIAASIRRDIKGLQPFVNKGEPVRKISKERKLIPFAKDIHKFALSVLK
ncbi:AAA family ATPase [Falsibacillus albus]|uniref:Pilus assembly protein CpaE n=1 Tax=Falsibacillus albus TaxID=2478915 RepID=A0A3L7JLI4_9BACI|nr:AAA family ATPase [Falsibacillus albus]RLQ91165.1 pilus assembly protein CpaE [Falsibacillus albus]